MYWIEHSLYIFPGKFTFPIIPWPRQPSNSSTKDSTELRRFALQAVQLETTWIWLLPSACYRAHTQWPACSMWVSPRGVDSIQTAEVVAPRTRTLTQPGPSRHLHLRHFPKSDWFIAAVAFQFHSTMSWFWLSQLLWINWYTDLFVHPIRASIQTKDSENILYCKPES